MKHRARQILGVLYNGLIFALAVFVPAGTLHWPRGWVFVAVVMASSAVTIASLPEDLLKERMKSPLQKAQPLVDKVILIAFMLSYAITLVFTSRDVFRYHLWAPPSIVIAVSGLALYLVGWRISSAAILENSFAAAVVKLQEERGHHVVDTGPYRVVRHPMYSGLILIAAGAPLWLGSYAAALSGVVPVILISVRIVFEERFLRRELPGYVEYTARTRYRLIPGIW
jgi:protein-S-isoprenylcysteine O-methyltransferase Ste14